MNDIKKIVAKNIAELRQANYLTQLDLAEKLNYSDKAISKWERGDSIPDISVLLNIADMFGVTLDYLIREDHEVHESPLESKKTMRYSRSIITLVSIFGVWLLAMLAFVLVSLIWNDAKNVWMCFVYAIPVSAIVWLVLNSIWFNTKCNYLIISVLMWSSLFSIHLSLLLININTWLIYLLAIPGQVIILLWSAMKKRTKN